MGLGENKKQEQRPKGVRGGYRGDGGGMKERQERKYAYGSLECTLSFFGKERKPAGDNKTNEGVTDNKRLTMSLKPHDL